MNYTKGERNVYKVGAAYLVNTEDMKNVGTFKTEADALLDAAAPDMYEALCGYVGLCGNTAYSVDREGLQHYWQLAQRALAKAEGKEAK